MDSSTEFTDNSDNTPNSNEKLSSSIEREHANFSSQLLASRAELSAESKKDNSGSDTSSSLSSQAAPNTTSHTLSHKPSHNVKEFANRPCTINDTGLSTQLLLQLLIKHILVAHVITVRQLADNMALSGGIIQDLLDQAKSTNWLENRQSDSNGQMRYALSAIGIVEAEKAFTLDGYLGVCPVPLSQYSAICIKQTSRNTLVIKELIEERFNKLMFSPDLISNIGPALNSSKPILIYGAAGVGKSYLCRNLNLIFGDDVLIPSAIEINNIIIQVFDPQVHVLSENEQNSNSTSAELVTLTHGYDTRWHLCQRPLIITGGELTADMLEVNFDSDNRTYKAPLQLKANNGILLLDDLGRQKISPEELFNRWIIPLEERRDFLSLPNGLHFEIPFELILLFSTNLSPKALVDDAFLRRLGYKIRFDPLSVELYKKLWFITCAEYQLSCDETVFEYLIEQCHKIDKKDYLPCLPRDLLSIVSDQIKFNQLAPQVNPVLLRFAWQHYYI